MDEILLKQKFMKKFKEEEKLIQEEFEDAKEIMIDLVNHPEKFKKTRMSWAMEAYMDLYNEMNKYHDYEYRYKNEMKYAPEYIIKHANETVKHTPKYTYFLRVTDTIPW